ncbi:hypothetical protein STBA_57080 [Streptomyces sp. MP131-18]|nr:hypothetical protein STBA_57080 [Streptomyces sp. MP131-18]
MFAPPGKRQAIPTIAIGSFASVVVLRLMDGGLRALVLCPLSASSVRMWSASVVGVG